MPEKLETDKIGAQIDGVCSSICDTEESKLQYCANKLGQTQKVSYIKFNYNKFTSIHFLAF